MALSAGDKLGPYEIIVLIGKGGMGEVYRARDTRLGRDVAVKISKEQFNERFEREARAVASLNHPNICSLYDVGPNYLVMEYIEGESPAGPLPIDEAMEIARQIAEALGEAHDKGVVHRDLKPANIKIKPDGTVKVLDFGLAKIGGGPAIMSEDSPTISMAATQAGVILGTAAYMAPEQARGKRVDARADIWAFGVVLYELITGQRLFKGEDLTDTLASVVKEQPDLSAIPPRIRRLLETCLQKDPKKRLQAIGDMRLLLDGAVTTSVGSRQNAIVWIVAGVLALVAAGLAFVHFREAPAAERSLRLSIPLPENTQAGFLQVSPDGRRLLMLLIRDGTGQLYVRSLDSGELQPLSGTTGARTPFWSPDSRFFGFFAESKLKVMPAAGGPAQVLCSETGLGAGGTWNRDGVILFVSDNRRFRRVDVNKAGQCTAVGKDDPNINASFPVFLPDGNHFFYVRQTPGDQTSQGVYLATLDEPVGRKILSDSSSIVYTPPASAGARAHLLFLRESMLLAQPFDEASLQLLGDPFTVAARASNSLSNPQVEASAAADGTLVYLAGRSRETQLAWFDRIGKELGKVGPQVEQRGLALSPDGNTVAILRRDLDGSLAVWLHDLVRESESRLTPPGLQGAAAVWSPDSSLVWFGMTGPEGPGIYQKDLKGGQLQIVHRIDPAAPARTPSDWSRDGRFIIFTEINPKTRADLWYAPAESGKMDEKAAVKVLGTDAIESQGQLSPDGKWLAYYSDESGKGQVYVRPFPSGSQVWRVSAEGGVEPRWRSDGKELYFITSVLPGRGTLTAATMDADGRGGLRIGTPQKLFEARAFTIVPQANLFAYSPHPDRQRFLVNQSVETGQPTVNVITNWQKSVTAAK
jgi:Tol biopolymer transport system component/predicted Ser/Thr protein kinase